MLEYYHRFMFYFIDNLLSFSFILSKPIYLALSRSFQLSILLLPSLFPLCFIRPSRF